MNAQPLNVKRMMQKCGLPRGESLPGDLPRRVGLNLPVQQQYNCDVACRPNLNERRESEQRQKVLRLQEPRQLMN